MLIASIFGSLWIVYVILYGTLGFGNGFSMEPHPGHHILGKMITEDLYESETASMFIPVWAALLPCIFGYIRFELKTKNEKQLKNIKNIIKTCF